MAFAESGKARVHYERTGEGRTLVLVTGLAGDATFWRHSLPFLDGFDVIAVDNRGAGLTEYSGRFSMQDMADDVVAVMDDAGVFKADIIGWSMGSHISLDAVARHPDRFRTLTLASAYLHRPARSAYILDYLADAYSGGRIGWDTVSHAMNVMLRTYGYFEAEEKKGRKVREMPQVSGKGMKDQMDAVDAYDAGDDADRIHIPTLSVHGLQDFMTAPSDGDEIADRIRGCERLRLPDEGHILRPSSYLKQTVDFIRRH